MTKDICPELVPYVNIYLLMLTVSTFVMLLALLKKKIFSNFACLSLLSCGAAIISAGPECRSSQHYKKSVDP